MALSEKDRAMVWRLGAILRLADALDHGYENRIKDIKFKFDKQALHLKFISRAGCQAELQAVEQKKDMFETAFNCRLQAIDDVYTENIDLPCKVD
jgi:hypothetical protein